MHEVIAQERRDVKRASGTLSLTLPDRRAARIVVRLQDIPVATAKAVRIRTGILTGTTNAKAKSSK